MTFYKCVIATLLIALPCVFSNRERRVPCKDPRSICVNLNECPHLLEKVQAKKSSEIIPFICALSSKPRVVKVCCNLTPSSEAAETESNTDAPLSGKDLLPSQSLCGRTVITDRVVGGSIAPIKAHSWMAALFFLTKHSDEPFHQCSATVINSRYLLTVAHCVHWRSNADAQLVKITIGDWNITNPGRDCVVYADFTKDCRKMHIEVEPENIIIHPEYTPSSTIVENDIALIRINKELDFSGAEDHIIPVCIPHSSFSADALPKYIRPKVTGWGITEEDKTSDVLLEVDVPIANKSMCDEIYGRSIRYAPDKVICAGGEEGKDSCFRDSGGPLLISNEFGTKFTQIGIISTGPAQCGLKGFPSLYTDVSKYWQWIVDQLEP